jgi:hypothetical protein
MKQEIIIGVSIALAGAVLIGMKAWLHSIVKFKMDESAILRSFEESSGDYKFRSTDAISVETDIDTARVSEVCIKSKDIERNSKEKESWCLKQ